MPKPDLKDIEPRQLGTLHGRTAYLIKLMEADPSFLSERHDVHQAAWDLWTVIRCIPDMAFENEGFGPLVLLTKAKKPKRGTRKKTQAELERIARHRGHRSDTQY
jgi:hypothetical protein